MKNISKIFLVGLFAFGFALSVHSRNLKLYVKNNTLYYQCPDGPVSAPASLQIDSASLKIINDNYFVDKTKVYTAWEDGHSHVCGFSEITGADPDTFVVYSNYFQKDKNYVYSNTNYWGWGVPTKIQGLNIDPPTFVALPGYYAKDKNHVFLFSFENNGNVNIVEEADVKSFEVLGEDKRYGMDKNNIFLDGKILSKQKIVITNPILYRALKGKIILKTESKGEAYYVNPNKQEMYYLPNPIIAFRVMRENGVGISNKNLNKITIAASEYFGTDKKFAVLQKGRILLQVEKNGEAWYVNPTNSMRYYLGRPSDAFNIMKKLGFGISNADFEKLSNK